MSVGRPPIGGTINIRLGDDLLPKVDKYANTHHITRAQAIRQLLHESLR